MNISRTPEIMADSAYVILTSKSRQTTDNFFLDDEVLISDGMNIDDLNKKYNGGTSPGKIGLDFMS